MINPKPDHPTVAEALRASPSDLRRLIPPLGLRNWWYPAIPAREVPRGAPVKRRLLGEDLCFFRDEQGRVVALSDVCPHRGASLSRGDCHFPGTVACPYHGWVFDGRGTNLAVLSEGPDSRVCGKKGTSAKSYPVREVKGVVFAWIGDDAPAAIEEDVPEEFFEADSVIFHNDGFEWDLDWALSMENAMDSHVNYVHRNNLKALLTQPVLWRRGATGARPTFSGGNGFRGELPPESPAQDAYPNGWRWPKTLHRRWWAWAIGPLLRWTDVPSFPVRDERWGPGHRLPSMFRAPLSPLFGLYTRWNVPVDVNKTRIWYFHCTKPRGAWQRFWHRVSYWTLHRWLTEYNFSQQDYDAMKDQRWDTPEKLSQCDAEVIQWRRLLVTKALGGRNAPFDATPPAIGS